MTLGAGTAAQPHPIGVSTWLWTSPLTDAAVAELAPRVRGWGFDTIELPIEDPGDWDPGRTTALLHDLGLRVTTCAVMTPTRDLSDADAATRRATVDYLRRCVEIAAAVGARVVAGPMYAPTGRCWRVDPGERARLLARVADGLRPVAEHAGSVGVRLALEPLNRYETSLVNTVEQALELIGRVDLPSLGLCLDTFHLHIEEKDPAAATRAARGHVAHVQACGTDRGTPGSDQFGWDTFLDALDDAGYAGPLCIESFAAGNEALARAASIWRPLASSADALALDGLAFLRGTIAARRAVAGTATDG
jgi:D-psicose/D-tagatose/L-ribulose 3-epimerase